MPRSQPESNEKDGEVMSHSTTFLQRLTRRTSLSALSEFASKPTRPSRRRAEEGQEAGGTHWFFDLLLPGLITLLLLGCLADLTQAARHHQHPVHPVAQYGIAAFAN